MYRIKRSYLNHILNYTMKTPLDLINGVYDMETWNKNGFNEKILEKVYEPCPNQHCNDGVVAVFWGELTCGICDGEGQIDVK